MAEALRIVVDLADVQRIARDVVATTPAPRIAEELAERLRVMLGEGGQPEVRAPSAATRERVRAKLRRYGA